MTSSRWTTNTAISGVVAIGMLALLAAGQLVIADPAISAAKPTFGNIPDAAWSADGAVDMTLVPDYVGAFDQSGDLAGYMRAEDILGDEDGHSPDGPIPVVNQALELVGHMVPDRGFVPLGQPFSSVDKKDITLYERDAAGNVIEMVVPGS